ncbi:MAG: type II CRISPR-associated endonuclease Cas1 [Cytophagales bacterium]|nr:MAG: type II CRISPR-associated endonuclease Cas1 [Cytophagales bacterium]
MIKRTIYFGNPAYLGKKDEQLAVYSPKNEFLASIPIEDIGILLLDHPQITVSHSLMGSLLANNVAFITCDAQHLPTGLMLNLNGNHLQSLHFREQISASEPLKKQLWQQTVKAKLLNQARHLELRHKEADSLRRWAKGVKSADSEGHEARAAAFYWQRIFAPHLPDFRRSREGAPPNGLLNYGYAILRAVVARSLVGSGLLPTLGIFHRNQYNAYCLADDIMEPYRPFVDAMVLDMIEEGKPFADLGKETKERLLTIATADVRIDGENSPLMVGLQRTTASLVRCFAKESTKILYPEFTK